MINKHTIEEPVASTVISHRFSHVVWSSVLAGFFVTLTSQLTLSLLGISIGFSTPTEGIGTLSWWIISGCVSFYLGSLMSGRMAGIPRKIDGMLHGVITFSLTTVCAFLFLTLTSDINSVASGKMVFASFVMLILGAILSALGGAVGAPHWADQEIV